ncbi:MAG TPA: peptidoglycan-binding protein [Candidatus Tectomicrobia bacterium]
MKTIVASVGHGGLNRTEDVRLVQELLNRHLQPPQHPLVVDGMMSPRTIAAIAAFQRRVLNIHRPDGHIQPGDCTMAALTRQLAMC